MPLRAKAGRLGIVPADEFGVDATGVVQGAIPLAMLRVAAAHRIAVFAVVSNYGTGGFSPAIAKAILAPGRAHDRAASGMVAAAAGTAGLNLDFEAVLHKERPLYTAFATRPAGVLHGAGLK